LIPKEDKSLEPSQFRPVCLHNIIYKIISKVMSLRLKLVLPILISLAQSDYVEGCQILDCITLVHEVLHSLKISKAPRISMKLDLYLYSHN